MRDSSHYSKISFFSVARMIGTSDRFEIFLALTYADAMEINWGPPGRFAWKRRSTSIDPYVELMGEAKRMGDNWLPVRAGLFKGSTKRFLETAERYKQRLDIITWC